MGQASRKKEVEAMMRSLWTAASGMIAQQTNVDTISNNLSNINTSGYKKQTVEFKSLLYQTIQKTSTDTQGEPKPVGAQVGLGVRSSAVTSRFVQGPLLDTGNDFDFGIEGSGFFSIRREDGTTAYTRSGSFQMSTSQNGVMLCTSEGYPVLDTTGNPIELDDTYSTDKIAVDKDGTLMYPDANNNMQRLNMRIGLAQFSNPAGLNKLSSSLMLATDASGEPRMEAAGETFTISKIRQGYLEGSNVQAVDEMVNMIVAQRAYEMNSKAITASDTMLQQANNLRA